MPLSIQINIVNNLKFLFNKFAYKYRTLYIKCYCYNHRTKNKTLMSNINSFRIKFHKLYET